MKRVGEIAGMSSPHGGVRLERNKDGVFSGSAHSEERFERSEGAKLWRCPKAYVPPKASSCWRLIAACTTQTLLEYGISTLQDKQTPDSFPLV